MNFGLCDYRWHTSNLYLIAPPTASLNLLAVDRLALDLDNGCVLFERCLMSGDYLVQ
jgi:hypothetical protein